MRRSRTIGRGGYVMVLFALLLFGLMAMAALVIDIGLARLTQRQMQVAATSAALEGLRGRSEEGSGLTLEDRQAAAEQIIAWTFDDDLDADNGGRWDRRWWRGVWCGPTGQLFGRRGQPESLCQPVDDGRSQQFGLQTNNAARHGNGGRGSVFVSTCNVVEPSMTTPSCSHKVRPFRSCLVVGRRLIVS